MPYKDPLKAKENKRKYYLKNKEELDKRNREWYKKNKEKLKEHNQTPQVKNRRKEYMREYEQKNKEKLNKRQNHLQKKRRRENKGYNIRLRLRNLIYLALRKYSESGKIWSSKKYGVDYQAIIEHLKPFPKDLPKYEVDHIKPLCSFQFANEDGSTNLEEVKKAFAPENHQWLTIQENRSKGGKII